MSRMNGSRAVRVSSGSAASRGCAEGCRDAAPADTARLTRRELVAGGCALGVVAALGVAGAGRGAVRDALAAEGKDSAAGAASSAADARAGAAGRASSARDAASSAEATGPVTVTDLKGRQITLAHPVRRAYIGFYLENVLAIAGPDAFTRVCAWSAYDTEGYFLSMATLMRERCAGFGDMVDVGSTLRDDLDYERLLALEPDCLIVANYQFAAFEPHLPAFEAAGIPVAVVNYSRGTAEDFEASTRILGALFGQPDRAEELIALKADAVADVAARVADVSPRKVTFNEYQSMITSYAEIGTSDTKDGFIGMLIAQAGGDDITADAVAGDDGAQASPEQILAADPDVMFLIGGDYADDDARQGARMGVGVTEEQTVASMRGMVAARPGWASLKAIRNGDVYLIDNAIGRTMRDYTLLQFMGKGMYPERFADVDPDANNAAFLRTYLPDIADAPCMTFYHYAQAAQDAQEA